MIACDGAGVLRVVAGVLCNKQGRVLLTQRPPGSHLAGMWEFPGGKCGPGETAEDALFRELEEELGIRINASEFLLSVPWDYPEKSICLMAFSVSGWDCEPRSREGQALRWQYPKDVVAMTLAPADRPILRALLSTQIKNA